MYAHLFKEQIIALIGETMAPQYRSWFCSRYQDLIYPDKDTTTPWTKFFLLPDLSCHSPRSVPSLYVTNLYWSLIACLNLEILQLAK